MQAEAEFDANQAQLEAQAAINVAIDGAPEEHPRVGPIPIGGDPVPNQAEVSFEK